MKRLTAIPILAFLLLTGAGCPNSATVGTPVSPRQQFFNTYTAAWKDANTVYEEGLRAVGRAKTAGLCDAACESKAIVVGAKVRAALDTARDALALYVRATDGTSAQAKVFAAFGDANKLLADLSTLVAVFKKS